MLLRMVEINWKETINYIYDIRSVSSSVQRMHIRRTDKKNEAAHRETAAYIAKAEEYFERISLEKNIDKKIVYIATDEPKIYRELQTKYVILFLILSQE